MDIEEYQAEIRRLKEEYYAYTRKYTLQAEKEASAPVVKPRKKPSRIEDIKSELQEVLKMVDDYDVALPVVTRLKKLVEAL